jgi:hypothetical protein
MDVAYPDITPFSGSVRLAGNATGPKRKRTQARLNSFSHSIVGRRVRLISPWILAQI